MRSKYGRRNGRDTNQAQEVAANHQAAAGAERQPQGMPLGQQGQPEGQTRKSKKYRGGGLYRSRVRNAVKKYDAAPDSASGVASTDTDASANKGKLSRSQHAPNGASHGINGAPGAKGANKAFAGKKGKRRTKHDTGAIGLGAPERLHKVLAGLGVASRRDIEEWIVAGRISVNGQPAHLGQLVGAKDRIKVNGRLVNLKNASNKPRVLIYHKPEGEIVSRNDPQGRASVFEKLPGLRNSRWVSVGRLDLNSSGLLLMTTSGDIAHRLMHPSARMEREYAVRVFGELSEDVKHELLDGVLLDDGLAAFSSLLEAGGDGSNRWYHVTLLEGRNREVRRMFESVGCTVNRLIRVRYGDFILPPGLKRGQYRELSGEEVQKLMRDLNTAHREAEHQQRFAMEF